MIKSNKVTPLALILSDTHLSKSNYSLVKNIFKQAIDICKERNIKYMFHLGDFFQSREAQPLLALDEATNILKEIADNKIQLLIIPGNHDKTDLESNVSYLKPLEKFGHELFAQVAYKDFNNLRIIWVPFYKENGSYKHKLESASKMIKSDSINVLLTHVSVSGVRNNDGSVVDNNISADLFKKFDKVFCGHYHNQQDCDNIFYIGGAFQQNFGEDNIKGFTVLCSDGSHEFIKSDFPEYIKIKVDINNEDELKKIKKQHANSKDNVRVILTGNKEKLQAFKKQSLTDVGIDVKFESDEINIISDINKNEIQVYDRSNLKLAFNKFCLLNKIDNKELGELYLEKICGQ